MTPVAKYLTLLAGAVLVLSVHRIGPTEVGVVSKRFPLRKLADDQPAPFRDEARLLMPGFRFTLWPIFSVRKLPWVEMPAGEHGVVIALVGSPNRPAAEPASKRPPERWG